MSFKEIVNQARAAASHNISDNGIRDWRNRHGRFRRINTRQCPDLSYEEIEKIVTDLNWVYKSHNSHPVFYNEWLGETHPIHNRSKLNKERVAHLSRQMGFTLMDIERRVKKEVRQLLFLERALEAFPEKRERLLEAIQDHKDSILPYDYLREEYLKHSSAPVIEEDVEKAGSEFGIDKMLQIHLEVGVEDVEVSDSAIPTPEPSVISVDPVERETAVSAAAANEITQIVSAPSLWALPMNSEEKAFLIRNLLEAKKTGIDPLLATIALAHDTDISFERVRCLAIDLGYRSESARGSKTTAEQREGIIKLIDTQLVEKEYTYSRYWSLVYATALSFRMWPKSVEKMIQVHWKYQFERPERPDPNIRVLPTEELFPGLLTSAPKPTNGESAKLPAPASTDNLEFQITTKERRIVEKSLTLDQQMLRKLLGLAGVKLGAQDFSLTLKDSKLEIHWSEA